MCAGEPGIALNSARSPSEISHLSVSVATANWPIISVCLFFHCIHPPSPLAVACSLLSVHCQAVAQASGISAFAVAVETVRLFVVVLVSKRKLAGQTKKAAITLAVYKRVRMN